MKYGTFLCLSKYCEELIKKFDMEKSKEVATPTTTSTYLDFDEKGKLIDESKYRGMIGYLSI